jgi:hypothetical protein
MTSEAEKPLSFSIPPETLFSGDYDEETDILRLIFVPDVPFINSPVKTQDIPESNTWWLVSVEDHSQVVGLVIGDLKHHYLPRHRQ